MQLQAVASACALSIQSAACLQQFACCQSQQARSCKDHNAGKCASIEPQRSVQRMQMSNPVAWISKHVVINALLLAGRKCSALAGAATGAGQPERSEQRSAASIHARALHLTSADAHFLNVFECRQEGKRSAAEVRLQAVASTSGQGSAAAHAGMPGTERGRRRVWRRQWGEPARILLWGYRAARAAAARPHIRRGTLWQSWFRTVRTTPGSQCSMAACAKAQRLQQSPGRGVHARHRGWRSHLTIKRGCGSPVQGAWMCRSPSRGAKAALLLRPRLCCRRLRSRRRRWPHRTSTRRAGPSASFPFPMLVMPSFVAPCKPCAANSYSSVAKESCMCYVPHRELHVLSTTSRRARTSPSLWQGPAKGVV